MADSGEMSKAAKKNQKRNKSKRQDGPKRPEEKNSGPTPQDVLPVMKQKLIEAKAEKDHGLAGKLRDQIWVLTDMASGLRTDLPNDELMPIVEGINQFIEKYFGGSKDTLPLSPKSSSAATNKPSQEKPSQPSADTATTSTAASASEEHKLRNLRKKLKQIESLKEKQAAGSKLEEGQLEKIKHETKVREEIEELEELLEDVTIGH